MSQVEKYWVSVIKLDWEEDIDLVSVAKGN